MWGDPHPSTGLGPLHALLLTVGFLGALAVILLCLWL